MSAKRASGYDIDEGLVAPPAPGTPIRIYDDETGELIATGEFEQVLYGSIFYVRDGRGYSVRGYRVMEWEG